MKAKETGQMLTGATAINDARIAELEELGFIWALRGSDGKKEPDDSSSVYSSDGRSEVGADDTAMSVASASTECTEAGKIQSGMSTTPSSIRGEYGFEKDVATAARHPDVEGGHIESATGFRDPTKPSSIPMNTYVKLERQNLSGEIKVEQEREIQMEPLEL
jgi:hypothetical protein